ncbi:SDR family NAD(P)-dependent oxidoreductase [Psychroflexus lacisalsi]|jgi:NAD(P)-dependent dehydrogenase (short-subunit alcohol dehydrogenase family)|uniref:SDR family NAD(P)-dependent oxidoreductase n=1 Tax=Psychroflexus lacisalsi TaxID=503928 RepID=A0ABN1K6A9_9FLAO|nr:SDR family oxidoreductase [Psychroflexus lacisalsi]MBZ9619248.1 SDR family oxidoreductase [Psychroflexus lacisalsi]
MIDIKNKTAFVTGSSRGIGQQIVVGLANLGCNVVVHGRKKENCNKTLELLKPYNVRVNIVHGELSEEKSIKDVIKQVQKLNVNIDILYNNAAIMTSYKEDFWSHNWEEWMKSMKTNVLSVYTLSSAFIPGMVKNGFGRVVNLVSGIKDQPELLPYSVSKWAASKITIDLAVKFEGTGVRINSLDPQWISTDLGGEFADHSVEEVLPGALKPVLIENDGPNGETFSAID